MAKKNIQREQQQRRRRQQRPPTKITDQRILDLCAITNTTEAIYIQYLSNIVLLHTHAYFIHTHTHIVYLTHRPMCVHEICAIKYAVWFGLGDDVSVEECERAKDKQ